MPTMNDEKLIMQNMGKPTDSPSDDGFIDLKIKPKFNLICVSKVKKLALNYADATRAKGFTRVGEDFLVACEANLKNFIQNRIDTHPSKGKTLM
jgi:hypothetical protein